MFTTAANSTQKMLKNPVKPLRSTIMRSTQSSRAKQAINSNTAAAASQDSNKCRGVVKSNVKERIPLAGKPDNFLKVSQAKKSLISSKNTSSTDTLNSRNSIKTRNRNKTEGDSKAPLYPSQSVKTKDPPVTQRRSRTPCTARTATSKDVDTHVRAHLWQRNKTCSTLMLSKNPYEKDEMQQQQRLPQPIDMGVQTNEKEILNHSLLVGDLKFLNPSTEIVNEIEKQRKAAKTQKLLKATRKFEAHSERQEEHLNDLKEFLEKSYVTKKPRKTRDSMDEEQKLFNAMDQFFNKDLPKTESFSDIKARIMRKERELLNLFDNVQTTASHFIPKSSS